MSKVDRSKLRSLMELAADPRTPENERAAAAKQLAKRLKDSGLLEDDEPAETRSQGKPGVSGAYRGRVIVITTPLVVVNEYDDGWRLAKLEPPRRYSSHIVYVPKSLVSHVEMMTGDELVQHWSSDGRVIRRLHIADSWATDAARYGWYNWR